MPSSEVPPVEGCTCVTDPDASRFGEDPTCPRHGYEAVIDRLSVKNERLREALGSLRAAWDAHMTTCSQHASAPSMAEIDAWMKAPSNTASSALGGSQAKGQCGHA